MLKEYKTVADILGGLRREVLAQGRPQDENEALFNKLLHRDMGRWVKDREWEKVEQHIKTVLGNDIPLEWLEEEFHLKH